MPFLMPQMNLIQTHDLITSGKIKTPPDLFGQCNGTLNSG